jgi:hypothetical protein
MRKLLAPIVACVLVLGLAAVAEACPGCKDSVSGAASADGGDGPTPGLPSGFNTSIYVMLAGLFSVMALVAGIVIKGIRGAERPARGFPVSQGQSRA